MLITTAKAALAAFWLLALGNLLLPFAGPYLSGMAVLLLLIHLMEIVVLHGRLHRQARPWTDRLQVLLFGVLHLHRLRVA
jgi:putative membrane protein